MIRAAVAKFFGVVAITLAFAFMAAMISQAKRLEQAPTRR